MLGENPLLQDLNNPNGHKPLLPLLEVNSDDEEQKISHSKALIGQVEDDITPLKKEKIQMDLQNATQVQVTPQLPSLQHLPALPRVDTLEWLMAQPSHTKDQARGQELLQNQSEQPKEAQDLPPQFQEELQKQKVTIYLQNTTQVKIVQRKQQFPTLQNLPDLPRIETLDWLMAQPYYKKDQVQGQKLQKQTQDHSPQLQVDSPPKDQPQEARCRKLCQKRARICKINMNSVYEMRSFLMSPCPPGVKMQCSFRRYRDCFSHRYECYLNENQYMMSATRESFSIAQNLSISFNKDYKKKDLSSYLGKITANFSGTEFEIFGQERSAPYKTTPLKNLGVVIYDKNTRPRALKAYIPEVDETTAEAHMFSTGKESILNKWKNGDKSKIYEWHNKKPKWNAVQNAYVLNFRNRALQASEKNFLIIDEFDDERVFLLLGKMSTDTFSMDFEWPLSPFQAFAICVTSFAY